MNYSKIKKNSIANWVGISVTLYVQGCQFHCKGCFQPETWNPYGGKEFTEDVKNKMFNELKKSYYDNLVLCGGEITHENNIQEVTTIAKEFKELFPNKKLIAFTGNVFENISDYELLKYLDYLIDGQFVEDQYSPLIKWRGSLNQRIINVQESLKQNTIILAKEFYEED